MTINPFPTTDNLNTVFTSGIRNVRTALDDLENGFTAALGLFNQQYAAAIAANQRLAAAVVANPAATAAAGQQVLDNEDELNRLRQEAEAAAAQANPGAVNENAARVAAVAARAQRQAAQQPAPPVTPAPQPVAAPVTPPAPAPAVTVNQVNNNGPRLFEWDRPGNPPGETQLQRDWSSGLMQLRDGMNNHETRLSNVERFLAFLTQPNWPLGGIVGAGVAVLAMLVAWFVYNADILQGVMIALAIGVPVGVLVALIAARRYEITQDQDPNNPNNR